MQRFLYLSTPYQGVKLTKHEGNENIREGEQEAFILGNGRKEESPLTPGPWFILCFEIVPY